MMKSVFHHFYVSTREEGTFKKNIFVFSLYNDFQGNYVYRLGQRGPPGERYDA